MIRVGVLLGVPIRTKKHRFVKKSINMTGNEGKCQKKNTTL